MSNWSDRWRIIRRGVLELHAWLALFGAIGIVFAAAVAVMSWVTNSITFLAQYGWGLPVLVAVGIVLVVVMGLSFAALPAVEAWRRYHPLPPAPAIEIGAPVLSTTSPSPDIDRLERQMALLRLSLPPLEQQGRELASKIEEIKESQHEINEVFRTQLEKNKFSLKTLADHIAAHENVVASGTSLLIRALRARDALRDALIPNDEIVMSLGKRLAVAEATSYPDPASWTSDFQRWNKAMRLIDTSMLQWTRGQHPTVYVSLFDLKGYHYEQAPMPPDNIRSDDTIIAFKTVCQVQSSYANQRDGIFSYFHERAVYPG